MKVRYFAWMKRTVGVAEEEVAPPAEVTTVGELVAWLRDAQRAAMPRRWPRAPPSAPPSTSAPRRSTPRSPAPREVAFFPPFTGG